ncbi:MAG TPA: hypothetical protein VHE14_05335 [Solirubrobacteraceae bacterium]|nr:hypothetical protein [Solirubrobacteraceae bacterium]
MSPLSTSRFVLVPEARPAPAAEGAPRMRRYRLARLSVNGRRDQDDRHGHLKRVYD